MNLRVDLVRQGYTEFGTLSRLTVLEGGVRPAFTCLAAENPWRSNRPGESCIPEGDYTLVRSRYHRGGYDCYQVLLADGREIPGRSLVKVHVGNTDLDVEGCIVLGNGPIAHRGRWGVGPSGGPTGAFVAFMKAMGGIHDCPLTIRSGRG